jgi:hypothetical protein
MLNYHGSNSAFQASFGYDVRDFSEGRLGAYITLSDENKIWARTPLIVMRAPCERLCGVRLRIAAHHAAGKVAKVHSGERSVNGK